MQFSPYSLESSVSETDNDELLSSDWHCDPERSIGQELDLDPLMRLALISHKIVWRLENSGSGYATDGGFPFQVEAISELFDSTRVVVPCKTQPAQEGLSPLTGRDLSVVPLAVPAGQGFKRKLGFTAWLIRNGRVIWREVRKADAVHTPIPGDVGTIGMLFALLQRKPFFVRLCGNWFVPRTLAERFWKWAMERFAGGRNVMLATGGGAVSPSEKNPNIKWIFSTSLTAKQLSVGRPRQLPSNRGPRLIIACRQEEGKGTDVVIDSLPLIAEAFPDVTLEVVGDGSKLVALKRRAESLGVSERVIFHGKVEQSRVPELLKSADIFCYPTAASEGFPKVVIEALVSGLPVITTKVSVLPHLISSGCGLILDSTTPVALAEAIRRIGSDRELYSEMSARAIETAANYSLENWGHFIFRELRQSWGNISTDLNCPTIERI